MLSILLLVHTCLFCCLNLSDRSSKTSIFFLTFCFFSFSSYNIVKSAVSFNLFILVCILLPTLFWRGQRRAFGEHVEGKGVSPPTPSESIVLLISSCPLSDQHTFTPHGAVDALSRRLHGECILLVIRAVHSWA